jgi:hypothetical protein
MRTGQRDEQRWMVSEEQRRNHIEAAHLVREQMQAQWQKTVAGVVALPAALALGFASAALYVGLFLELGFDAFQRTANIVQGEEGPRWRDQPEREREQPRA